MLKMVNAKCVLNIVLIVIMLVPAINASLVIHLFPQQAAYNAFKVVRHALILISHHVQAALMITIRIQLIFVIPVQ